MKKDKKSEASDLRQKAEKIANRNLLKKGTQLTEVDTLKLIHELEVHQIELEMQMDELNRSNEALEISQMRYSELYDLAPIGFFSINEAGKISDINLMAASLLGMNRGELVKQDITRFIFPDDLDYFYAHRQLLFEKKKRQVCELRIRPANGKLFRARLEAVLKPGDDGKQVCFMVMSDITKEKLAEEQLRKSEERYRLLIESSGIGVGYYSLDGEILYFNLKAIQNLGGKPLDYIGRSLHEVFGKEAGDDYLTRLRATAKSRVSLEYEDFVPLQTGNYWFLSNYTKVLNPDGTVAGVQVLAHDITNRKFVEDKLKTSEERFRLLSYLLPVGIYLTDKNGKCIYTNKKWNEMSGLSESESLGDDWINGIHPDDRELIKSSWLRMVESEGDWGLEYRFMTPEGKISWVHGLAVPHKDGSGQVINYIGVNIDITNQKEADKALKESEEKYRKLVELSPDAIVVHTQGTIVYVNAAAIRQMGAESADEIVGKPAIGFVHPDYRNLALQRIKNLLENNAKAELIHEKFIRLNGESFDVETTAIPFIYDGKPSVQLIVRDITERLRMEEARQESEKKFQTLFESANDALFLMDGDSFIECNPMTLEVFACTKEQIIGQSPFRFSPEFQPDGSHSVKSGIEKIKAALGGTRQFFGWKHSRFDGTPFDAEVMLNAITIKGEKYLQASVRDISQRKQAEEKLKQSEAQYRLLADNMTDMVWLMDFDLNTFYISPSIEKIRGYTFEELKQLPLEKNLVPASLQIFKEFYQKELPKVYSSDFYSNETLIDLEFYKKSGTTFWLEIVATIIRDESRKPVSILCVGRDITEHKKISEKLKESEERLDLFFSQSLDGFFFMLLDEPVTWNDTADKEKILDYAMARLRLTKINKAMLEQYGATEDQFIGRTISEFFAHDTDQGREILRKIFNYGHLHAESVEKKLDGTDMIIDGDYICSYDSKNRITGHFGIQRDITGHKQDEEKIQRQLDELLRWQLVTLGREDRIRQMKQEVNELLVKLGEPARYPSQATDL
jgi:PAS domain S-box-containing protein